VSNWNQPVRESESEREREREKEGRFWVSPSLLSLSQESFFDPRAIKFTLRPRCLASLPFLSDTRQSVVERR